MIQCKMVMRRTPWDSSRELGCPQCNKPTVADRHGPGTPPVCRSTVADVMSSDDRHKQCFSIGEARWTSSCLQSHSPHNSGVCIWLFSILSFSGVLRPPSPVASSVVSGLTTFSSAWRGRWLARLAQNDGIQNLCKTH